MMERRYEAYKTHVVRPFFREHFARLDRQIVLVDVLAALNAGPEAVRDLEARADRRSSAASGPGRAAGWSSLFAPRIDRILFAATKADHLHHTEPRPARSDPRACSPTRDRTRAVRRRRGRRRSRLPRCARRARHRQRTASSCRPSSAIRCRARPSAAELRRQRSLRHLSRRPAGESRDARSSIRMRSPTMCVSCASVRRTQ